MGRHSGFHLFFDGIPESNIFIDTGIVKNTYQYDIEIRKPNRVLYKKGANTKAFTTA